jgi:PAS domain S-box-containing protein
MSDNTSAYHREITAENSTSTALNQDTESLAENETQYRALFDAIDVGFCIFEMLFDKQGKPHDYRFVKCNPAFERHTGLVDAVGKTARELVPSLDDFWFQTYGDVASTGKSIRFENHAPAMERWFEVHAVRVGSAEEGLVGLVFNDITERKNTLAALRERDEQIRTAEERERIRLTNIFMRAPAFMTALRGPNHIYELANLPYYQLIGKQNQFSAQGIIGKTVAEVIPEMVEQGFIALLDQVYQTGQAFVGKDTPVAFQVDPQGPLDQHFVDFTFQPLFDEQGTVSGILVHGVDLTERRRLEHEREQLVHDLRESSVRQRRFLKEMLAGFTEGRLHLCFTESELPVSLTPLSDAIKLSATTLRHLRKQIETSTKQFLFTPKRVADFLTASHEAAMNAVRHGGGGTARIYGEHSTGTLQVWISDDGPGIAEDMIHRAVERGFTTGGFGQGFFYMQSCTDRLYLFSVAGKGTTAVLEMDRKPLEPIWARRVA